MVLGRSHPFSPLTPKGPRGRNPPPLPGLRLPALQEAGGERGDVRLQDTAPGAGRGLQGPNPPKTPKFPHFPSFCLIPTPFFPRSPVTSPTLPCAASHRCPPASAAPCTPVGPVSNFGGSWGALGTLRDPADPSDPPRPAGRFWGRGAEPRPWPARQRPHRADGADLAGALQRWVWDPRKPPRGGSPSPLTPFKPPKTPSGGPQPL